MFFFNGTPRAEDGEKKQETTGDGEVMEPTTPKTIREHQEEEQGGAVDVDIDYDAPDEPADENLYDDDAPLPNSEYHCDYDVGVTSLYKAVELRDWDSVLEFIDDPQGPEEAATWVCRYEEDRTMRWRILPIHAATIFKAPDKVIEELLRVYPDGGLSQDDQGMIPLHLAFRHGCSDKSIHHLLHYAPRSFRVKDCKGRIPIELKMPPKTDGEQEKEGVPPKTPARGQSTPKAGPVGKTGFGLYVELALENEKARTRKVLTNKYETQITELTSKYEADMKEVKEAHDKVVADLTEASKKELEEMKENAAMALDEVQNNLAAVEDEKERVRLASQALIKQYNAKSDEEKNLRETLAATEIELEEMRNVMDAESGVSHEQQRILETINSEYGEKVKILENENGSLKEQVEELSTSSTEKLAALKAAREAQEADLKATIESLKSEIAPLRVYKSRVDELEETNDAIKVELASSLDKIVVQENQIDMAKRASETLISQYRAKAKAEEELKEQLAESQAKVAAVVARSQEKIQKVDATLNEQVSALKGVLDSKEMEITTLTRDLNKEKTEAERRTEELKEKLSKSKAVIRALSAKSSEVETESESRKATVYMLEEKTDIMQRVSTGLQVRIAEMERENASFKAQLADQSVELEKHKSKNLALKSLLQDSGSRNSEMEDEIISLKKKIDALSSKLFMMTQEQDSVIEAAMKQEQELRSTMEMRGSIMEQISRQLMETQASADAERKRILEAARKQKDEIDSMFLASTMPTTPMLKSPQQQYQSPERPRSSTRTDSVERMNSLERMTSVERMRRLAKKGGLASPRGLASPTPSTKELFPEQRQEEDIMSLYKKYVSQAREARE